MRKQKLIAMLKSILGTKVIAETKAEVEERVMWDSLGFGKVTHLKIISC